MNQINKRTYLS